MNMDGQTHTSVVGGSAWKAGWKREGSGMEDRRNERGRPSQNVYLSLDDWQSRGYLMALAGLLGGRNEGKEARRRAEFASAEPRQVREVGSETGQCSAGVRRRRSGRLEA